MKKIVAILLVLSAMFTMLVGCGADNGNGGSSTDKAEEFYELVSSTQDLLDEYADDIYRCWYDYIYNKKYSSVDAAILAAYTQNVSNYNTIEANNETIKELYKEAKDGDLSAEVKAVMQAYNEYYSFVMEVSGSFNSYSAGKETNKKALSNALKNLQFEL